MSIRPLFAALFVLLLGAQPADAQFWKKAREAAKRGAERAVERETARRADAAVTGMFELGDDVVGCVVGDDACVEEARAEGKEVVYVDDEGTPLPDDQQPTGTPAAAPDDAPASMRPGEGAWANYDFVPGQTVLFFDDYERAYVGDVPRRLRFINGAMEVVENGGSQMLRFTSDSRFALPLPATLPERFTVEFDLFVPYYSNFTLGTSTPEGRSEPDFRPSDWPQAHFAVNGGYHGKVGVFGGSGGTTNGVNYGALHERMVPVRIAVDGSYVKMYLDQQRIANIPNADIGRGSEILVHVGGWVSRGEENWIYLDNVRVAEGGRDRVYEKLAADGRYATQGILFDTGSATIRPESTPTLSEIARALQQHGDLRLRIEGHTDNTGSAEANQQLSERRAAAVRDYLVQREGIGPERLESAGMGQAVPVADNATPEGRQTNRRVELVVL
ncbi:MAG: OmpA family protein [Bacteroidota bacterium]